MFIHYPIRDGCKGPAQKQYLVNCIEYHPKVIGKIRLSEILIYPVDKKMNTKHLTFKKYQVFYFGNDYSVSNIEMKHSYTQ
jgi:hypothetical protein